MLAPSTASAKPGILTRAASTADKMCMMDVSLCRMAPSRESTSSELAPSRTCHQERIVTMPQCTSGATEAASRAIAPDETRYCSENSGHRAMIPAQESGASLATWEDVGVSAIECTLRLLRLPLGLPPHPLCHQHPCRDRP